MHASIWLIIFSLILIWFIIGIKICYSPSAKSEIITNVKKGRVQDNKAPNTGEKFNNAAMSRNYKNFIRRDSCKIIMNFAINYEEEYN